MRAETSLAKQYLSCDDYMQRRAIFSTLCCCFNNHHEVSAFLKVVSTVHKVKHPRLRMSRLLAVSPQRYKMGRKHGLLMEQGFKLKKRPYSSRVSKLGVLLMLKWTDRPMICGWKAGKVRDQIISGERVSLPKLYRDATVTDLWGRWKVDSLGEIGRAHV